MKKSKYKILISWQLIKQTKKLLYFYVYEISHSFFLSEKLTQA
jgi:hypothetical protein